MGKLLNNPFKAQLHPKAPYPDKDIVMMPNYSSYAIKMSKLEILFNLFMYLRKLFKSFPSIRETLFNMY